MTNTKVKVFQFTDPACTWCWGSEPIMRKLETYYGDQIQNEFIMGGLVPDIREFFDSYNNIGGNANESNKSVASHWLEASERHGMPVQAEGFALFSDEHPSTFPMNIAYKAAQFEDYELADKFLRRMREAVAAEAVPANQTEKLIELAQESGLDIGKFLQHFTDGSAEEAFQKDLKTTYQYKAQGFPSFLVQFGEKGVMLRGYQVFDNFKNVIDHLSDHTVKGQEIDATEENILAFIEKYDRVVKHEIKVSFDLQDTQLDEILQKLEDKNLIKVRPIANGFYVEMKKSPLACDSETGICHI